MKFLRNKLFMGMICIALSLIIVFIAAPAVASEQTKTTEVCTAIDNIDADTVLTDDMLKTIRIPANIVPTGTTVKANCIGKYASSKIWAGDIITISKLTDTLVEEDTYAMATAKGKMVVSVTVKNLSVMAAARLKQGDCDDHGALRCPGQKKCCRQHRH